MAKINFPIPAEIRKIAETIRKTGNKAYVVGGALRDFFLVRRDKNDFDMATDAPPQLILSLFPRVIPTGIKHGTVTILLGKFSVEITTLRTELGYSDGRRPDAVVFGADIEEDLARRDFTMNAMALDVVSGEFFDPFGGRADIKQRLIKAVGEPSIRFDEDGLRPLRAIRFASQLGFSIDSATFSAIPGSIGTFKQVSMERVREEINKILLSPKPSSGLRLLETTDLLRVILPELLPCRGCEQKGFHVFDVLDHLYDCADKAEANLIIRLAALLHDVGKPAAKALGADGTPTFFNHEKFSAKMATAALERLKFPNAVIDKVAHLIANHMFNYTDQWTDAAVRRLIGKVGVENLNDLFKLRLADSAAITGSQVDPRGLAPLISRIESIIEKGNAFKLADLAINGDDLAKIGIPKGPAMGKILNELLETVLDDTEQNESERLLSIAGNIKGKYLSADLSRKAT
jgi:tRNA nucleotidyltransferase (CCA-adding enzyme)